MLGCCSRSFLPSSLQPVLQRAMSDGSPHCSLQLEAPEAAAVLNGDLPAGTSAVSAAPAPAAEGHSAAAEGRPQESGEKIAADGTRISKVKVALVLGYNGSRFNGLQRNPGQLTIEDVLEEAVYSPRPIHRSSFAFYHRSALTFPSDTKPVALLTATTTTFTRSAGRGRPGRTKACTPLATSFRSRCSRLA